MAKIEARLSRAGHSVVVAGDTYFGWLQKKPKVGDEIVHYTTSGHAALFRIRSVKLGKDAQTYHGKVKPTRLFDPRIDGEPDYSSGLES